MSVILTLRAAGDPKALEQYVSDNAEKMQGVLEAANTPATLRDLGWSGRGMTRPPPDVPELCGLQKIVRWPLVSA